jgi:hypothetical protein
MKFSNWAREGLEELHGAWIDFITRISWSGLVLTILLSFAVAAFMAAPWLAN